MVLKVKRSAESRRTCGRVVCEERARRSNGNLSAMDLRVRTWRARIVRLRCSEMPRVLVFLFIIGAIPWAIFTLWEMRRSHGPRERAWVGRASFSLWLSCLIGSFVFFQLAMRGQFFLLPLFIVAGLGARYGLRRVRARIRLEESDPLSRARRLN